MNKTTILIVEDEAIIAADLAGKLRRLGYGVAGIAAGGEEAVRLAEELRPHLVLMDIRLEGAMDGIAAAEAIRRGHDLPVIYLTAHSDQATLARAKITGPFGYILKPFEERELATHIELGLYKHQADRQVRQEREWLRVTLTSIGDAVIATDSAGRITFINPVAESLTGWQAGEAAGQPLPRVFHVVNELSGQPLEDLVVRVLREGHAVELANHAALVTRDGRLVPVEDSAAPILDAAGQVIGAVLVFHDVTAKRRAEEALRESEERHRRLFESMVQGVIYRDPTGRITAVNPAAERIFGFSRAEMAGRVMIADPRWQAIHEDGSPFLQHEYPFMAALREGAPAENVIMGIFNPREDRYRWIIADAVPQFRPGEDQPYMVYTTFSDITERRQSEQALHEAREDLQAQAEELQVQAEELQAQGDELRALAADLRRSEESIRSLALFPEQNTSPVLRIDRNGCLLYANFASRPLLAQWQCAIGQYVPESIRQTVNAALAKAVPLELETIINGRSITLVVSPVKEASYANLYGHDITRRKQAEEELRQSREDLDRAQEVGRIGWWRLDTRRNVLTWSDENYRIFGLPRGTPLTYQTFMEMVHPADRQYVDTQWHAGLRGEPYDIEHRLVVNGQIKWVREKAYLEFDEAGELLGGFGITQDITDRKQVEDLMQAINRIGGIVHSTRNFDEIMQSVILEAAEAVGAETAAISLRRGNDWIVSYVYGFPEKLLGSRMNDQEEPHALLAIRTKKPVLISDAFTDERVNRQHMRKWGIRSVLVVPLVTEDQVLGVIFFNQHKPGFSFDESHAAFANQLASSLSLALRNACLFGALQAELNERKETEKVLTMLKNDLEVANREIAAFSYSVSHDLRAPLRSIDGFSRALLDDYRDQLDETARDYLRRVCGGARKMEELIDAMLSLSRLTGNELVRERVNLSAIAAEIADELRKTGPERQVEFVIAENLTVLADSAMMRAVLDNLLSNAWKFTAKHDRARIEFGAQRSESETIYCVRDDGAGFAMDYVNRLFTAFQRLHRESEFSGIGIGLATVQRIIHRHGGRIWAEGEVEKGATFSFTLE